ncbi:MATE family efflux transporter, partial [Clostridium sp. WILCCON 0269]
MINKSVISKSMVSKSVIREALDISLPVVGETIIYTLMLIFDTMMIGNYGGNKAVSVVGISNEILYVCVNTLIAEGICIGIASYISRSVGARKYDVAEEYASIGFTIGVFLSIIICCSLFKFSEQVLHLAGTRGEVLVLSNIYTKMNIVAIFFNMLINIISSILRGYGNTFTPFIVSSFTTVIKLVLDWILIFGVMGVIGAAIASVIAQVAGFIFIFTFLIFRSKIKIKLKYILLLKVDRIKKLLILSVPSSMEEAAFSLSRLFCTFIIMRAGTVKFAANQIANTVESVSVMPGIGFGIAATTLVGIKVGEKNYKKAREYTYACAFFAVTMMSVLGVIFLLTPGFLVNLFVGAEEKKVTYLASLCLFIGAFEQPSIAISSVFAGALKGAGDTKSPFLISLITSWIIRLPLTLYFIYLL